MRERGKSQSSSSSATKGDSTPSHTAEEEGAEPCLSKDVPASPAMSSALHRERDDDRAKKEVTIFADSESKKTSSSTPKHASGEESEGRTKRKRGGRKGHASETGESTGASGDERRRSKKRSPSTPLLGNNESTGKEKPKRRRTKSSQLSADPDRIVHHEALSESEKDSKKNRVVHEDEKKAKRQSVSGIEGLMSKQGVKDRKSKKEREKEKEKEKKKKKAKK